jgi:hypothetical protein
LAGAPNPESLVLIRSIIRTAIQLGKPIPVLSAAGPKKTNSGEIDLAEFSAMQKLVCLQERVRKYYQPGMSFRIRIEDTTGTFFEPSDVWGQMDQYCADFIKLCRILESRIGGNFLYPWLESYNTEGAKKMLELSHSNFPTFLRALETGDQAGVQALGWKGGLGPDWKKYLDDRYARLFPSWTQDQRTELSAKYLANKLARFQAGMGGSTPEWSVEGKNIDISFATPGPGDPKISSRVYYRTMSVKQTKRHLPFWRAKGFFRLVDGQVKMGLDTCNTSSVFIPGNVTLKSKDDEINIRADFLQQE